MEVLIGIVGSVAAEIGKSIVTPVKRHIGYLIFYNRNIKNLQDESKKLDDKRAEADLFVQDADKKFKVPIPGVPHWKKEADELNQTVSAFLEKETHKACNKFFIGCCQNPCSRYSSSRKAFKMTTDIHKKNEDAPEFGNVAYDAPPPNLGSTFNIEGLKDFESRYSVINDVWEALENDKLSMIGICGMGGVGKTTLVKKIVKKVENKSLFGLVVMIVVSQKPNYLAIQDVIAEQLGLKIEEKTLVGRARKLHDWIMKCEKSTLLILDDVWEMVDLEAIGLPLRRSDKGYKIVLTSRKDDLCKKIGSQKNFLIDTLTEEEARDLFKETAGYPIHEIPLHTAITIADELRGLPIAILTVAKALKGKAIGVWEDALLQLKKSNMKAIPDMEKEVYSQLELSFNLLESDEAKELFLLSCLFPEDVSIPLEYLACYGMGLRLFKNVQNMHEARNRVCALIDQLKESFLLLDGDLYEYESIKMHDLLRDVAISIVSRDRHAYLVSCDSEMKGWPREIDRYEDFTAISLIRREIQEHPIDLECPKLRLLRLSYGYHSQPLPNNFFEGMKELKVLCLAIPLLPQSLDILKKLRTLHLKDLESREISSIGALISLEILRIGSRVGLTELPREIGLLSNLKVLNLREMFSLRYIPFGVLSRLSKLEELSVVSRFMQWESTKDGKTNASLKELESHSITALDIYVQNALVLPKKLVISNLKRFKIRIEGNFRYSLTGKASPNELYIEGDGNDALAMGIASLLKDTDVLGLEVKNVKNSLFDEIEAIPCPHEISMLQNKDPIHSYKLKQIEISYSDEMKYVFPLSMARGLKQLQRIHLSECGDLEGIFYRKEVDNEEITSKDGADDDVEFPKLQFLVLVNLPKFIGFWVDMVNTDNAVVGGLSDQLGDDATMKQSLSCKLLSDIAEGSSAYDHMNDRTRIRQSFSHCITGPTLFSLQWIQLPNLQELIVSRCHLLKVLFSTSVAGGLMQLQELTLKSCDKLEYVVAGRQDENKGTIKIVFPKLKILHLTHLPELMVFCPDGHTSFELPSLKELTVEGCPKMKEFCPTFPSPLLTRNKSARCSFPREKPNVRPIFPWMTRRGRKQKSVDSTVQQHNSIEQLVSSEEPKEVPLMKNNDPSSSHIKDDKEARSAFPFESTLKLKQVLLNNGAFEVIFSFKEWNGDGVMLNVLEKMDLLRLSKLTHIWFKIPLEIIAFQNLKELIVEQCHCLKYVFSPRVVKLLVSLEKVNIGWSSAMEAIVAEEEETSHGKIEFPRLRSLRLTHLHKLKNFCLDRSATVEFPLLETLSLGVNNQMRTLSYKSSVITSSREDVNAIVEEKNKGESGHSYNQEETCSPFSISCIEGMRNLKHLSVFSCDSLEVMLSIEESDVDDGILNNLEILELGGLRTLEHVWLRIPQKIKAFQNLKQLRVEGCHRLEYLFSPLVAKLLVQLTVLEIRSCDMVKAVVVAKEKLEEDETSDKIVFPKLRKLQFEILPNLRSFFMVRSVTIELPLLEDLTFRFCKKINIFSYGSVITPKLEEIIFDWSLHKLMEDVNTTLQQITGVAHFTEDESDDLPEGEQDNDLSEDEQDDLTEDERDHLTEDEEDVTEAGASEGQR